LDIYEDYTEMLHGQRNMEFELSTVYILYMKL
jgi:hypothetical protein